jgi:hypothetical protein
MADPDSDPKLGALLTAMKNQLPFEIVSEILDYAEVWRYDFSATDQQPRDRTRPWTREAVIIISRPLSHWDISLLRRVTFSFMSKLQVWGNYRTFLRKSEGTPGFLGAGLLSPQERMQLPDAPPYTLRRCFSRNAPRTYHFLINGQHVEVGGFWECNVALDRWHGHQLFENLCPDDSIVLMACGRFNRRPGCAETAKLQLGMADFRRVPSNGHRDGRGI